MSCLVDFGVSALDATTFNGHTLEVSRGALNTSEMDSGDVVREGHGRGGRNLIIYVFSYL